MQLEDWEMLNNETILDLSRPADETVKFDSAK